MVHRFTNTLLILLYSEYINDFQFFSTKKTWLRLEQLAWIRLEDDKIIYFFLCSFLYEYFKKEQLFKTEVFISWDHSDHLLQVRYWWLKIPNSTESHLKTWETFPVSRQEAEFRGCGAHTVTEWICGCLLFKNRLVCEAWSKAERRDSNFSEQPLWNRAKKTTETISVILFSWKKRTKSLSLFWFSSVTEAKPLFLERTVWLQLLCFCLTLSFIIITRSKVTRLFAPANY